MIGGNWQTIAYECIYVSYDVLLVIPQLLSFSPIHGVCYTNSKSIPQRSGLLDFGLERQMHVLTLKSEDTLYTEH
ncbi:hypothetical protein PTKIN_Ptkin14bG0004200 [Pterospermum kingtungense]